MRAVSTGRLLAALMRSHRDRQASDPRSPLRGDVTGWILMGCVAAVLVYLVTSLGAETTDGPQVTGLAWFAALVINCMALALYAALLASLLSASNGFSRGKLRPVGAASLRYIAFLLCTRGQLPWRLGRFLHHCYELELLRAAGTAYQFRHSELQEHLAIRPEPPPL